MERVTAADAGCWIDGHHGQYTIPMMLRIATERGWDGLNEEESAAMMLWLNEGSNEVSDDEMYERLIGALEEAETWLNEHIAPEGYSFGWSDGEFFLSADVEWEAEQV